MTLQKILFVFVLLIMTFLFVKSEEQSRADDMMLPELKEIEVSYPYCGIYSLVTILGTFDKHPDIKTLLIPEYIGSFKGSSNEELVKAAESNGLYAQTYGGLTWHELKTVTSPMILHFRNSFADEKYNHWVAYLGVKGKHARIIDFPKPLEMISFAELMAKWDGTAIVISDKPINSNLIWALRVYYFSLVSLLFCCVFFVQYFLQNKKKRHLLQQLFCHE
jgi:hypothetical protein